MEYNTNNYNEILKALDLPNYWENRLKSKVNKKSVHSLRMLEHLGDNVSGTAIAQNCTQRIHILESMQRAFL